MSQQRRNDSAPPSSSQQHKLQRRLCMAVQEPGGVGARSPRESGEHLLKPLLELMAKVSNSMVHGRPAKHIRATPQAYRPTMRSPLGTLPALPRLTQSTLEWARRPAHGELRHTCIGRQHPSMTPSEVGQGAKDLTCARSAVVEKDHRKLCQALGANGLGTDSLDLSVSHPAFVRTPGAPGAPNPRTVSAASGSAKRGVAGFLAGAVCSMVRCVADASQHSSKFREKATSVHHGQPLSDNLRLIVPARLVQTRSDPCDAAQCVYKRSAWR